MLSFGEDTCRHQNDKVIKVNITSAGTACHYVPSDVIHWEEPSVISGLYLLRQGLSLVMSKYVGHPTKCKTSNF